MRVTSGRVCGQVYCVYIHVHTYEFTRGNGYYGVRSWKTEYWVVGGGKIRKRASGVIVSEWKRSVWLGRGRVGPDEIWTAFCADKLDLGPVFAEAAKPLPDLLSLSVSPSFSRALIIPSFPSLRPYHLPCFIFGSPVVVPRTDGDRPLYIIKERRWRRRRYSLCDRLTEKRIFISSLSHHRQVVFPSNASVGLG